MKFALVLATNNPHKIAEIRSILKAADARVRVLTLSDFPQRRPVVENAMTIEGNAAKKARAVAKYTGCLALADDTGLFVRALKGRPGVFSARFAGPGCTYAGNNRKILRLMRKVPPRRRTAVFRCVAALATPGGKVLLAEGRISGQITEEPRGGQGFGYDPVFLVPRWGKTFAEMGPRLKNKISHRAKAFQQVPRLLKKAKPYQ